MLDVSLDKISSDYHNDSNNNNSHGHSKSKTNNDEQEEVDPDMITLEEKFSNLMSPKPLIKFLDINKLLKMPTYKSN